MASNIFSEFAKIFNRIVDIISQGNLQRVRLIHEFNLVFHEAYLEGSLDRHCRVSTSPGNPQFRHEMSTFYLRSGFKITIENDDQLKESDFIEISKYVTDSIPFVRQLMALGYDTLIIIGKNHHFGHQVSLKEIANLRGFSLPERS